MYDNENVDIALALSAHFSCVALFIHVSDETYLFYKLYSVYRLLDAYSRPDFPYFDVMPSDSTKYPKYITPRVTTGNAVALCEAFGVPNASEDVDAVLKHRMPGEHNDWAYYEHWLATEYQKRLFAALRLPKYLQETQWKYDIIERCVSHHSEEANRWYGFPTTATFMHTGR